MQSKTLTPAVTAATSISATGGVDLGDITTYSFYALFSGSNVAGTFKLQVSNDGTNYVDLSGATSSISASGDAIINATDAGYRYVRHNWAFSSGTGNITVIFCAKEAVGKTRNRSGK